MKNEHGHKEISAFRNERDQRDAGMGANKPGQQRPGQQQPGNKNPGQHSYNNPADRDQNRKASQASSFGKKVTSPNSSDC